MNSFRKERSVFHAMCFAHFNFFSSSCSVVFISAANHCIDSRGGGKTLVSLRASTIFVHGVHERLSLHFSLSLANSFVHHQRRPRVSHSILPSVIIAVIHDGIVNVSISICFSSVSRFEKITLFSPTISLHEILSARPSTPHFRPSRTSAPQVSTALRFR